MISYKSLMIWLLLSYALNYREAWTTLISVRDTSNIAQNLLIFWIPMMKITFFASYILICALQSRIIIFVFAHGVHSFIYSTAS